MIAPPPEIEEIEHALDRHGIRGRKIALISTLQERKGRRWAYRVETDDGRIVKARQFESYEAARLVFELRVDLEEAFAPALAQYGPWLIEEWIEGVPLTELDWEAWVEEAGALLGRLHIRPLGPGAPSTISTRKWREGARSDLELLDTAGKLTPREVAVLRAQVLRRDPGDAQASLLHMDFCADNMLIDHRGHLRIIDNELLTIGPVAFDLGRTFNLWPMPDATWVRFRRGYVSSARTEPESIGFWQIIATLIGARIFLNRSPARLDASLAQLRRFIDGEGLVDP